MVDRARRKTLITMPTKITPEFLKPYFKDGKKHKAYDKTVEIMARLDRHANGKSFGDLISDSRPSESPEVKAYRKKIEIQLTKSTVSKIINCLSKIRKSQDWSIKYDKENVSSKIAQGETPYDYHETKFPYFTSLTNWVFNVYLKNYLIDANAICLVMPLEFDVPENGYLRPFPIIFNSDKVIDFVQEDYAILKSTDKATYTVKDQTFNDGEVYYVVTTTEIQKWEQVDTLKTMKMAIGYPYVHGLGKIPAFKVGGVFKEAMDTTFIYESRIDSIVPRLNEAVREYSDLQGGVVTSLNMERWEVTTQECLVCNGLRKVKEGTKNVKCKACNGTGHPLGSPYGVHKIKASKPGEPVVPTPPIGFVNKPIEILELQDKRVEKHIWWALSAVNMEFLMEVPLNESGKAKEVDRDDLNVFVNSIAEDVVAGMDKIYYLDDEIRYRVIVPSQAERLLLNPNIAVPEKFDLINASYLAEELNKAKLNGVSPLLVNALEVDYANKKFQGEPQIKEQIQLVFKLDPFPGIAEADKMSQLTNKGITLEDYTISSNIVPFVTRAIFEYEGKNTIFANEKLDKQIALMKTYAQEKIKDNSAAEAVMKVIQGANDPNNQQQAA